MLFTQCEPTNPTRGTLTLGVPTNPTREAIIGEKFLSNKINVIWVPCSTGIPRLQEPAHKKTTNKTNLKFPKDAKRAPANVTG